VRIGFDLDGVLADLHGPFVRAAVKLFPALDPSAIKSGDIGGSPPDEEDVPAEPSPDAAPQERTDVAISNAQSDAIWKHLESVENFWETLAEIESGAIARIAALTEERRWEVMFVTSRPYAIGRTVQRQSQRWLQGLGFPMPSAFVVHGSRGRIAEALRLDVVIDDRPENCLDVVLESKAGAILVWRGDRAGVPASARRLGIAVVPTVAAALDAIVEAERSGGGGRMLDRLRRLFGLKTGSATGFLR
jgi:hypothetical protein